MHLAEQLAGARRGRKVDPSGEEVLLPVAKPRIDQLHPEPMLFRIGPQDLRHRAFAEKRGDRLQRLDLDQRTRRVGGPVGVDLQLRQRLLDDHLAARSCRRSGCRSPRRRRARARRSPARCRGNAAARPRSTRTTSSVLRRRSSSSETGERNATCGVTMMSGRPTSRRRRRQARPPRHRAPRRRACRHRGRGSARRCRQALRG